MPEIIAFISKILGEISFFSYFLTISSFFVIVFSKYIVTFLDTSDLERRHLKWDDVKSITKKQNFLKFITALAFILHIVTFYIHEIFLTSLTQIIFVSLVLFLLRSWVNKRILIFYWNEIEIGWHTYIKRWYKTQIFSFINSLVFFVLFIYIAFQIFWIDSLLEWGGIIAWILALVGFTAHVWWPDLIASIMILHNWEVEVWNVIRIKKSDTLAWVKNINLSEVKLIDLVYGNPIIMRPSSFRNHNIENLSNWVMWKRNMMYVTLDIKVWYDIEKKDLEKLVFIAFDEMIQDYPEWKPEHNYFPENVLKSLEIVDFWNDAVCYRFGYYITSPFYIVKASRLLNEYLLKYQKTQKIYFSTPKLVSLESKSVSV